MGLKAEKTVCLAHPGWKSFLVRTLQMRYYAGGEEGGRGVGQEGIIRATECYIFGHPKHAVNEKK